MNECFTIGDFCFRLICPEEIEIPENFLKFRGGERPVYTYTLEVSDAFPPPAGRIIARRPDLLVAESRGGECRYIGVRGAAQPYACYEETAQDAAHIRVCLAPFAQLNCDPVFTSLLALERRQIRYDALILHCAFMELSGGAILFSAPSETGKTTQANLWQKYRGTRTVNGDRALIQKKDGVWLARGWPVCGTSDVCHNRELPIRAIVMLSQAPEDSAERLPPVKAFTQVFSQITVNRWNTADHLRAMELTEQLIADVQVFHLACTMNVTAVEALERALTAADDERPGRA